MCKGKVNYSSQAAAISGAISASRKTGKGMRPYKAPCGKWHLTTKPKEVYDAKVQKFAGRNSTR